MQVNQALKSTRGVLLSLFILFCLALSGCAGSQLATESEPVALPTPFSGSMTGGTNLFLEEGLSTQQTLFMGHRAGQLYPLTDSTGGANGTALLDLSTFHDFQVNGDVRSFLMSVTIDDGMGSTVTTANTQFLAVPAPEFPLTVTQQEVVQFSGEADAVPMAVSGVASGEITGGTGIYAGGQGSIEYRLIHEVILHSDGVMTFYKSNFCSWVVNPL